MTKRRSRGPGKSEGGSAPAEIPMTDLGWNEEGERPDDEDGERDIHAAGTPGGGTASGGLAGTNKGEGDPDDVDLEDALGSGIRDNEGEDDDGPPYAGPTGGAVGGTPAQKRAKGGDRGDRLSPGGSRSVDSTIGSPPPEKHSSKRKPGGAVE